MAINYRTEYQRYRQYYANLRRFYQKPTIKVSFFVLLSFATVTFFTALAIRPTITTIGALIRDIEDKRSIDEQLENKLKVLDEAQSAVAGVEADEDLLKTALPEDAQLGRFLQELEYIALEYKVQLSSVKFGGVTLGKTVRRSSQAESVPIMLSVEGSFSGVKGFLALLENMDRLVVVQSLRLASGGSSRQGGMITAEVGANIHYVPVVTQTMQVEKEEDGDN